MLWESEVASRRVQYESSKHKRAHIFPSYNSTWDVFALHLWKTNGPEFSKGSQLGRGQDCTLEITCIWE